MSMARAELRGLLRKTLMALTGVPPTVVEDELMFALDEINSEDAKAFQMAEAIAEGIRYGHRAHRLVVVQGGLMIRVLAPSCSITYEFDTQPPGLAKGISQLVADWSNANRQKTPEDEGDPPTI